MINDNYKLRYLPLFFDAEGADKIMEVRRLLFNKRDREKLV